MNNNAAAINKAVATSFILARIGTEVGSLDGLVNNAGIGVGGVVETLSDDDWRRQMD